MGVTAAVICLALCLDLSSTSLKEHSDFLGL